MIGIFDAHKRLPSNRQTSSGGCIMPETRTTGIDLDQYAEENKEARGRLAAFLQGTASGKKA